MDKKIRFHFTLVNFLIFSYPLIVSFGNYVIYDLLTMITVFVVNLCIQFLLLSKINKKGLYNLAINFFTISNFYFYFICFNSYDYKLFMILFLGLFLLLNILIQINSRKISITFFSIFIMLNVTRQIIDYNKILKGDFDKLVFKKSKSKRNIFFIGIDGMVSSSFYKDHISSEKYLDSYLNELGFYSKDIKSAGKSTLESYANLVGYTNKLNNNQYRQVFSNKNSMFYKDLEIQGFKKQFAFKNEYFGIDAGNIYDYYYPKKISNVNFCNYVSPNWGYGFCGLYKKILNSKINNLDKFELFRNLNSHIYQDINKWFSITHIWFPGHTSETYNAKNTNELNNYKLFYIESINEVKDIIKNIFNEITNQDPNAIIVFMGDHGSTLYRGALVGDILNNRTLTSKDILDDKRNTLLSIYPKNIGKIICDQINDDNTFMLFRNLLKINDSISLQTQVIRNL